MLRKKSLFYLGDDTASRYSRYGDMNDLETATVALQNSLMQDDEEKEATDLQGSERGKTLTAYSQCLRLRYMEQGTEGDLKKSLSSLAEALEIYNDLEDQKNVAECELLLAITYEEKFLKNTEIQEPLDRAIEQAELAKSSSKGLRTRDDCMEILARLYERRYLLSKDTVDLLAAIGIIEDVFAVQDREAVIARYHYELGRLYLLLTQISGSSEDGSETTRNLRRSLKYTPMNDPTRPQRLEKFSEACDYLSKSVGLDIRDRTTRAEIAAHKLKLSHIPGEDTDKARILKELSFYYYDRYESGLAIKEGIKGKNIMIEAVNLTPEENHEDVVERVRTVAFMCYGIFKETDNPKYLEEALSWARRVITLCQTSTGAETSTMALAFHTAARILFDTYNQDVGINIQFASEAVECATRAVELISACCEKSDGCRHCLDKEIFTDDLKLFGKTAVEERSAV